MANDSGLTQDVTFWGILGVIGGLIVKSNQWVREGAGSWFKRIDAAKIWGDLSAGLAIFGIATLCMLVTNFPPISVLGFAVLLSVLGLNAISSLATQGFQALFDRIRGGASGQG